MRNYSALSFTDYEKLIGDLFGAEFGVRYERFGAGRDGGVDLRHLIDGAGPDVVQVKHYWKSSWSDLKKAAVAEASRAKSFEIAPSRYRFVTSQTLTPGRKAELAEILAPFALREDDVWGGEEVDDLLDRHPDVERRHIKLWLASSTALQAIANSGVHSRSQSLASEITRRLPLWVPGEAFLKAREKLGRERVLVLSGQPGIGKTTLAQILVADAIGSGYAPVEVSKDVEDAWSVFSSSTSQIFLYDDFLGQTSLVELTKNEDSRLVSLMGEVARSNNKFFVLTTREYILQRAAQLHETMHRHGIQSNRVLLELPSYSMLDRANILANHVWHSNLPVDARLALAADRGYQRIVDHENYNPRLIEFVTSTGREVVSAADGRAWLDAAEKALDHPDEIWRIAYERQLDSVERGLVLVLGTFLPRAELDDLRSAHDAWCSAANVQSAPRRFERALEVIDDSFARTEMEDDQTFVSFTNPGVRDFVERQLREDQGLATQVLDSVVFFDQLEVLLQMTVKSDQSPIRDLLMGSLVRIANRTYESASATWIRVNYSGGGSRFQRDLATQESRLSTLIVLTSAKVFPRELRAWIKEKLDVLVAQWHTGRGTPDDALELARHVEGASIQVQHGWLEGLKALIAGDPGWYGWSLVIEFRDFVDGLFSEEEEVQLRQRFLQDAESILVDHASQIEAQDEIDELIRIAEELDVVIDASWVRRAEEELSEKLAMEELRDELAIEQLRDERSRDVLSDPDEMLAKVDLVFSRLVNE